MLQHRPCSRVKIPHRAESLSNDAFLFITINLNAKEDANTAEIALSILYKNIYLIQDKYFSIHYLKSAQCSIFWKRK